VTAAGDRRAVAVVTGAAGQDGFYLARRLLDEGCDVHAVVRRAEGAAGLDDGDVGPGRLVVHELDVLDGPGLTRLVADLQPDEVFNLAGQSSVARSFREPGLTWATNVQPVISFLEAIRAHSPDTRLYQSSSSEMFGAIPGAAVTHDEASPLAPQSPYAAAKAAAHVACGAYRAAFGLRVACGILFNHESSRRPPSFLSRKVADHVRGLRMASSKAPRPTLRMGSLDVRRDWGYAPDYVEGILLITRQVAVRASVLDMPAETDDGAAYRDYVLATGQAHAVWELVDRAFHHGGFELKWRRDPASPQTWTARFADSGALGVEVDPSLVRPADPAEIRGDPSRARRELGWSPRAGLDPFLREMLEPTV
jgi:GDPmannose 4,6-dehydratase